MTFCPECGAALEPDGTCTACLLSTGLDAEPPDETDTGDESTDDEAAQAREHDSFGPYHIVRELGEGGMGAVYLAEQTRPIRRKVALKVVKLGLDSRQILSRFNYERQALALMDHPNIARVYDAGVSAKGRPYFVMEFVDGVPVTQYCDQHRLNTRERLELFLPVCQALQHAHQKGIIHRDIKPSNLMVMEQDARPVPKVIDFGIAKATGQGTEHNATFTGLGQFIGTPEYMSPEQADVLRGDVDTGSDVYSLGVVLYELLIGSVPFDGAVLQRGGVTELLRVIRENEAVPLAAKLTAMGKTASEVADRRRTDPISLRRQVAGDLNSIVMKAMEKDRRRRYSSASELAADIRRYLDGQAVLASPPSTMYRARKFVRRHKLPVVAAAAVFVALVAGMVVASWQAAIARRERAQAEAARALAEKNSWEARAERNRAEEQTALAVRHQEVAERQRAIAEARLDDVHALADSMLFELNDDVKDLVGGTKARETLIRLGQQYLTKEAAATRGDPRRRRELAEAFIKVAELEGGAGQSSLYDAAGAIETFGRSISILEVEVKASPHDSHLRHLLTVAHARLARLEPTEGEKAVGYARALKSADIFSAQWPNDPQGWRDRAEVMEFLDPAKAVQIRERVLAGNPNDLTLHWELARSEGKLGTALLNGQKDTQGALKWFQKAYDLFEALSREEPGSAQYQRDVAVTLWNLALTNLSMKRLDQAESLDRRSIAILEHLTAADRRNANFAQMLSSAQDTLAAISYRKGRTNEARQAIRESLSTLITVENEQAAHGHPKDLTPRWRLARVIFRNGLSMMEENEYQDALESFEMARGVFEALSREKPGNAQYQEDVAVSLWNLAVTNRSMNRLDEAETFGRQSIASLERLSNADRRNTDFPHYLSNALDTLAVILFDKGRGGEALQSLARSIAIKEQLEARLPDNAELPQRAAWAHRSIALYKARHGDRIGSLEEYRKAEVIDRRLVTRYPDKPEFAKALKTDLDSISELDAEANKQ